MISAIFGIFVMVTSFFLIFGIPTEELAQGHATALAWLLWPQSLPPSITRDQMAFAPSDRELYSEAEIEAKEARRGLWHDPKPMPPWEYRISKRKK